MTTFKLGLRGETEPTAEAATFLGGTFCSGKPLFKYFLGPGLH